MIMDTFYSVESFKERLNVINVREEGGALAPVLPIMLLLFQRSFVIPKSLAEN